MTALLVARPLFPSESAAAEGDGMPVVMLWIALAVGWLLGAIGRPRIAVRFGWVERLVLALAAWHTLAGVWAVRHGAPRPAINMLWEWIGLGISFLLARQLVAGRREARAMVAAMLGLVLALSVVGLIQFFVEGPATRAAYQADPDRALQEAGIWYPPGSPEREAFEKRLYSQEPTASFALTNTLAGLIVAWLVPAIGVALAGLAFLRAGSRTRPHSRPVWLALALVIIGAGLCLLLTKSRTAYLAAGIGAIGMALALYGPRGRLFWKIAAGGLVGVCALAAVMAWAGGLDREIVSEAGKSLGYRGQYWRSSVDMALDHPWFGVGPGNFQFVYTRYKLPEASEEIAEPHNALVEVWTTAGTPALTLLLGVLALWGWTVLRAMHREPDRTIAGEGSVPAWDVPADDWDGLVLGDHPRFVLGGALGGYLLGLPLALLSAATPSLAVWWVGLPIAGLVVALAWPWIRDGDLPLAVPVIGAFALLVNLLAAGAMGFPGLAGSLWLLLALSLNLAQSAQPQTMRRVSAAIALLPVLLTALCCYGTAYRPVLEAQAAMRRATDHPSEAIEAYEEAARADPVWAAPWRQLANLTLERWKEEGGDPPIEQFDRAARNAMRLEPHSARLAQGFGDGWFEMARNSASAEARDEALACYQEAARLYPTSAAVRAKLAEAYHTARQFAQFRHQAEKALALDRGTPHEDKKLRPEVRQQLQEQLKALR